MRLDKSNLSFFIGLNVLVVGLITGASYYHIPLQGGKDTIVYLIHLCLITSYRSGATPCPEP